jgi:hypothetical protein
MGLKGGASVLTKVIKKSKLYIGTYTTIFAFSGIDYQKAVPGSEGRDDDNCLCMV